MKKILKVVILLVVCSITNVFANNYKTISTQTTNIKEEITPIYEGKNFIGIDVDYTIPEDYTGREIILTPSIFGSIGEQTYVMPGDKIKINISVNNLSSKNYNYKENSFILQTDDITRFGTDDNFIDIGSTGFDGRKLYDVYSPYRVMNKAILNLYNVTSSSKLKTDDLKNENLDLKLKERGYAGIEELSVFYLDYYNKENNLSAKSLNEFNYDIIRNIFNGKMVFIKESDPTLICLSYNFFYNKLLSFTFENEKVTDKNSEEKSIGKYMSSNMGNEYFSDSFKEVLSNSKNSINNMSLNINGAYTVNVFMYYNILGYLEFRLVNNDSPSNSVVKEEPKEEIKLEEGLIIPPNTGIN